VSDTSPASTGGYEPEFFDKLILAEDRHFWFRHRNAVITECLKGVVADLPDGYRVLEVGCGTGNTLRVLEQICARGVVVGTDPFEEGLAIARRRVTCELVQCDIRNLPVPGSFDLIGAFDVIEHLAEDREALAELRMRLTPKGRLMVTVPAHMELWSYADEAAHHQRRYSAALLRDTLESAGYAVEYLTSFMSLLYPLMWAGRRFSSRQSAAGGRSAFELTVRELRIVPGWNEMIFRLLAFELPKIRARRVSQHGTSLLAVATLVD
jgi:SAM-dependent methyltransferase